MPSETLIERSEVDCRDVRYVRSPQTCLTTCVGSVVRALLITMGDVALISVPEISVWMRTTRGAIWLPYRQSRPTEGEEVPRVRRPEQDMGKSYGCALIS